MTNFSSHATLQGDDSAGDEDGELIEGDDLDKDADSAEEEELEEEEDEV